jgi:integrase
VDFWDTALPCFACRVSQGGAKTFILKIQNSRRAIGRWPLISLSQARTEAKRLLAEKTLGKIRPQSVTFPQALDTFLSEKAKSRRPRTVQTLKERLNQHFALKGQLAEITHQEIARRLSKIKTSPEHDHALAVAKTFFTWAYDRRLITDNPVRGLAPHGHTARSRVLSDQELVRIWRACEQRGGASTRASAPIGFGAPLADGVSAPSLPANFCAIVKLLILTGQRRGEIAALQFSWIKENQITFPASVTKNSREHVVPISGHTASLLAPFLKTSTSLLFPARARNSPFKGWSKAKAALDRASGVTRWTLHDARRTFATRLAEMGVAPHIIERLLNHVSGQISGVSAIYNRARYFDEMRQAVTLWEDRLQTILKSEI